MSTSKTLTTSWGKPIADNQNSVTAGPRGPVLIQDATLVDKLAHFDRERIPERAVHAKGGGAHGYFKVTQDVTRFCRARFLDTVGKQTPAFVRFSTVGGENGSADTDRDPRGFAVKFYTEEGNFDMAGNNTPTFFIRDPLKFPDLIHRVKKNPQTGMKDPNTYWDFLSLQPESVHQVTYMFGNRGTPDGYRFMNGYSSHTLKWVNYEDQEFFVQMHIKADAGVRNLKREKAVELAGKDPDYSNRDLYNFIDKGGEVVYTMFVQVMTPEQASKFRYDIFDITKVWPHGEFPLIEVGKLVLNRNPANYFAEVEQSAFSPAHLVPGIEVTNDRILQARLFSYNDTQRHRLGTNFDQIPINAPYMAKTGTYRRDGFMNANGNQGNLPNYQPNSVEFSPAETVEGRMKAFDVTSTAGHYAYQVTAQDFEQTGMLYRAVMDAEEKEDLVQNLAGSLKKAEKFIQERQLQLFYRSDPEYGTRVATALGLPVHNARLQKTQPLTSLSVILKNAYK